MASSLERKPGRALTYTASETPPRSAAPPDRSAWPSRSRAGYSVALVPPRSSRYLIDTALCGDASAGTTALPTIDSRQTADLQFGGRKAADTLSTISSSVRTVGGCVFGTKGPETETAGELPHR